VPGRHEQRIDRIAGCSEQMIAAKPPVGLVLLQFNGERFGTYPAILSN
jgi:hypothetical protein